MIVLMYDKFYCYDDYTDTEERVEKLFGIDPWNATTSVESRIVEVTKESYLSKKFVSVKEGEPDGISITLLTQDFELLFPHLCE